MASNQHNLGHSSHSEKCVLDCARHDTKTITGVIVERVHTAIIQLIRVCYDGGFGGESEFRRRGFSCVSVQQVYRAKVKYPRLKIPD